MMAQHKIQLNIDTKYSAKALQDFQRDFQRSFKTTLPDKMAADMLRVAQALQKLGSYKSAIEGLKKGLDVSAVVGKSSKAFSTFIRLLGPDALGAKYKYVRTEAELMRRATQATKVTDLVDGLRAAATAVKPLRMSLVKTDADFQKIYVRTQLIKERLIQHRSEIVNLRNKVASLRKEYDHSAETAKSKAELQRLGQLKNKLDVAEKDLKAKTVRYQKDLGRATAEQKNLVELTNKKLQGQTVAIKGAADQEKRLSDNARVVLNTVRQQAKAQADITIAKEKQAKIDTARREAYALQIAGNQLKSYGDQFSAVGRQAAEAFASIDFQVRRAAAASGVSFENTAEGIGTIMRPASEVNAQLDLMNTTAKRAAESLGFIPTEEVARGMYFFASTTGQGFNTVNELNTSMSQLTPIMQAAAITSTDLETTIKGVYGVLNQYSLGTENAASVTEMLYFAAQKTAAEFPDFIESLKMLGPVAAQAGVGFEDTLKSLAVLADSGIRGTTAGRALRQMFLQLNDPADRATKALDAAATRLKGTRTVFKDLVYDAKGNFLGLANYIRVMAQVTDTMNQRQKTNLLGIISTAAETPALTKLIQAESDAMKKGTSIITDNSKEIADASKARELFATSVDLVTKSTQASLGRIDVAIKNIKATFGAALAPALEQLSYALATVSEKFDAFAKNNPELLKAAATLTMIGAGAAILSGSLLGVLSIFIMLGKVALPIIRKMGAIKGIMSLADEGAAAAGAGATRAARSMADVTTKGSILTRLFGGLKTKLASPFASLGKSLPGVSKLLGSFGGIIAKVAGVFKMFGFVAQAIITFIAGAFVGLFEGLNNGKKDVDVIGGAFKLLEPTFQAVGAALDVIGKAFGLIFELGRTAGLMLANLFGDGGPLNFVIDIFGGFADGLTQLFGFLGEVIDNVTGAVRQMNDDSLDPMKVKLSEIRKQIQMLEAEQSTYYGNAAVDNSERIAALEKEAAYLESMFTAIEDSRQQQKDRIAKTVELQTQISILTAKIKTMRGEERKAEKERLAALELERGKLLAIIEATRIANAERTYFLGGNQDIVASRNRIAAGTSTDTINDPTDNTNTGGTKKTAREKALELAQQAASLAEALYKIEGINLKELIRKTMGKVAEAMKLAIKLTAPYAKAFKTATLEKVGNFAGAVGGVASAVGSMVEAAEKLANYKSPSAASLKKIISDMSVAMKYMIAEAKKFAGSQVIAVQAYSDGAQSVVGSIAAAVEAFNSMATGVYQPPERVLKQVAEDISKAVQAFVSKLSSAPTQPMLDKAKSFAEAADSVLGTIGSAIGSFKDLRNYVKPLASDLQAVVSTIEMAVRQMLVSMGRFSLNKDQWEVVNTFANVAKSIADAVGGTYDAFVKQMDFVDQFRTEIDYDKVFGWIEDGIRKMADIASSMPVGMIAMAKDAADAAKAIAEALEAFFNLAVNTGGDPALLADSLQGAVNTVLAIIEAFASTSQIVGAQFVDSLIVGMQSRESALAAEANRLNQIMAGAGTSITRQNSSTITINHVVTDPNGVLKNASAQEVASMLSGDVFINNLVHSIKTQ